LTFVSVASSSVSRLFRITLWSCGTRWRDSRSASLDASTVTWPSGTVFRDCATSVVIAAVIVASSASAGRFSSGAMVAKVLMRGRLSGARSARQEQL
jgi:hypothetical protein